MFLTRSKTSSALNEEQLGNGIKDNVFPVIPTEMISVLEESIPAIDLALKPILSESGHELIVNMISTWVITSRITDNNLKINNNKSKPLSFRSWASRSFPIKSKSIVVAPAVQQQKIEISDNKLCHKRIPSFTHSGSTASSFSNTTVEDQPGLIYDNNSPNLYTPLLHDSVDSPTSEVKGCVSKLPVSLKSMIDLLETPPLIHSDDKSLSLVDENLTPLSSTFFHDNDHIQEQKQSNQSPASIIAPTFTTASENDSGSGAITTISLKDSKSMRRSLSTMFIQIGHSVKKAFKKKSQPPSIASVTGITKAFSVQESLSLRPSISKHVKLSYSTLSSTEEEEDTIEDQSLPYERPEAKAYAAAFATFMSTGKIDKSLADIYGGKSATSLQSSFCSATSDGNQVEDDTDTYPKELEKNIDSKKHERYWDGDTTQSQQFDKLLDDIWERSQEYQDYFAAEEGHQQVRHSITSFSSDFNTQLKNKVWSPAEEQQSKLNTTVRPSKTEGNMTSFEDSVPFVCVGKQRIEGIEEETTASIKKKSHIPQKHLNIEDIKAYKRSTSAYSNIRDYDINWQESFHLEKKSKDKVVKTLKSISWGFFSMIQESHTSNQFSCDPLFDENDSSMSELSYDYRSEPLTEWNDIFDQLAYVFDCGELTSEHAIITFIYVKRMLDLSKQNLWDFSWRMIIMSSLLTAVKVWDDCAIFNADFAMIFPELTLDVINNIERVFLTHLQWDVSVSCSEFAKTYFQLREIEHMMDQW